MCVCVYAMEIIYLCFMSVLTNYIIFYSYVLFILYCRQIIIFFYNTKAYKKKTHHNGAHVYYVLNEKTRHF